MSRTRDWKWRMRRTTTCSTWPARAPSLTFSRCGGRSSTTNRFQIVFSHQLIFLWSFSILFLFYPGDLLLLYYYKADQIKVIFGFDELHALWNTSRHKVHICRYHSLYPVGIGTPPLCLLCSSHGLWSLNVCIPQKVYQKYLIFKVFQFLGLNKKLDLGSAFSFLVRCGSVFSWQKYWSANRIENCS